MDKQISNRRNFTSSRKKGIIIAKADLQLLTTREIAEEENVTRQTVYNILKAHKNNSLPPEVQEYAKKFESQFAAYADANALKASQRVFEDINNISADKASKVAETMFNIGQVVRGQATTRGGSDLEQAFRFALELIALENFTKEVAIQAVADLFEGLDVEALKRQLTREPEPELDSEPGAIDAELTENE
jgi:predicted transcriptional regulator